jgi:hypothetical protein
VTLSRFAPMPATAGLEYYLAHRDQHGCSIFEVY